MPVFFALLLAAPSAASAATEIGDSCGATSGASGYTLVQLSKNPASTPPLAAPSSGVITAWKVNVVIPLSGKTYTSQLKVMRPASAPPTFTVVSQSAPATISQGLNVIPTRISVQAGDRLGLGGGESAIQWYCETADPLDQMGYVEKADITPGATQTFTKVASSLQEGVTAVIEPDADGDGFGDETQDACPQSATTQAACPPVSLSTNAQVKKGAVIVLVTPSTPAPVSVKGVVGLGKGKKAALSGGKTQNLSPGAFGKFTLKFTKKLKTKLKELNSKQFLTLKVTVTGTNVAGQVTTKKLKVKLKGRG